MNREQIIAKIDYLGGTWKPTENLTFTLKEDDKNDVRIEHKNGVTAFLWSHFSEPKDIYISSSYSIGNINTLLEFSLEVATLFDFKIEGLDKEVVVNHTETSEAVFGKDFVSLNKALLAVEKEKERAEGMNQAYEKILIGRDLTVGK